MLFESTHVNQLGTTRMNKHEVAKEYIKSSPFKEEDFDIWETIRGEALVKDCEEFAVNLSFYLNDKSWYKTYWKILTNQHRIITYINPQGVEHMGLWINDGSFDPYIDNITLQWNNRDLTTKYGFIEVGFKPLSKIIANIFITKLLSIFK